MTKAKLAAHLFTPLVVLVVVPSLASAQSTISGVVKDASGAVIPGVTVEAASEVLIERSRTVVTSARTCRAQAMAPLSPASDAAATGPMMRRASSNATAAENNNANAVPARFRLTPRATASLASWR